jgi:hypothetical protein
MTLEELLGKYTQGNTPGAGIGTAEREFPGASILDSSPGAGKFANPNTANYTQENIGQPKIDWGGLVKTLPGLIKGVAGAGDKKKAESQARLQEIQAAQGNIKKRLESASLSNKISDMTKWGAVG